MVHGSDSEDGGHETMVCTLYTLRCTDSSGLLLHPLQVTKMNATQAALDALNHVNTKITQAHAELEKKFAALLTQREGAMVRPCRTAYCVSTNLPPVRRSHP